MTVTMTVTVTMGVRAPEKPEKRQPTTEVGGV
jgi:hypothetical protein